MDDDKTMRAARLHGQPVRIERVPAPEPGPDEVVVDLRFSGVDPLDLWVTEGNVAGGAQPLPFIPGCEASGLAEGRPVLVHGQGLGTARDGLYRERAAVPRAALFDLPAGVDLAQAATLGIAGLTAWNVTRRVGAVERGDRALVLGASGGVGSLIVQLCKAAGAAVWGQTSSEAKAAWIVEQGADRAVTSAAHGLLDAVAGFGPTIVFDPLGGPFTMAAIEALEPFGRLVIFGTSAGRVAELNLQALYRKGIALRGYSGTIEPPESLRSGLEAVVREVAAGRLRVPIDAVLPLEEAPEALRRLRDREVRGKLVLRP